MCVPVVITLHSALYELGLAPLAPWFLLMVVTEPLPVCRPVATRV